jgi:hypothetical protein
MKPNPWAMTDHAAFRARMDQFYEEGGGLARAYLVRGDDDSMRSAIDAKDPLALALVAAVVDSLKGIELHGSSVCCLGCERVVGDKTPGAFLVWLPGGKTEAPMEHENVMAMPICIPCVRRKSTERLFEAATAMIARIFPNMEIMDG